MSLSSEVANYKTYLGNAWDALETAGATIPENKNLENVSEAVGGLSGGYDFYTLTFPYNECVFKSSYGANSNTDMYSTPNFIVQLNSNTYLHFIPYATLTTSQPTPSYGYVRIYYNTTPSSANSNEIQLGSAQTYYINVEKLSDKYYILDDSKSLFLIDLTTSTPTTTRIGTSSFSDTITYQSEGHRLIDSENQIYEYYRFNSAGWEVYTINPTASSSSNKIKLRTTLTAGVTGSYKINKYYLGDIVFDETNNLAYMINGSNNLWEISYYTNDSGEIISTSTDMVMPLYDETENKIVTNLRLENGTLKMYQTSTIMLDYTSTDTNSFSNTITVTLDGSYTTSTTENSPTPRVKEDYNTLYKNEIVNNSMATFCGSYAVPNVKCSEYQTIKTTTSSTINSSNYYGEIGSMPFIDKQRDEMIMFMSSLDANPPLYAIINYSIGEQDYEIYNITAGNTYYGIYPLIPPILKK